MNNFSLENNKKNVKEPKDQAYYEEIIQNLQKENDILRQQLFGMKGSSRKSQEIFRAETLDDESLNNSETKPFLSKTALGRQSKLSSEMNSDSKSKDELFLENKQLKLQLQNLTINFELKIKQLTNFSQTLKKDKRQQISSSAKNQAFKSNINKLLETMENIITMFQLDRVAYIAKIEQLVQVILALQKKQMQYIIQEKSLGIELQLVREQLAIYKRLRKAK